MATGAKLAILLHGWLGRPGAFGALPAILKARGHDVLPLFSTGDSWPRTVTIEDLTARLEERLGRERHERPTVLIAHSLGGLVALNWMLRYHAEKDRRPPVERLVTFGTPRHGLRLQPVARAFVHWGLVPGTALARQMQAPNPFLWDLTWSELRHAELLPPIIIGAGLVRSPHPVAALVGGRESDGVVPTVCSQPNATFLTRNGAWSQLPPRLFRVFPGREHSGRRGLYAGLKPPEDDARTALLVAAVEGAADSQPAPAHDEMPLLRQTLVVVRHAPGEHPVLVMKTGKGTVDAGPTATHREGLALFLLQADQSGEALRPQALRAGSTEIRLDGSAQERDWRGGQVVYVDGYTTGVGAMLNRREMPSPPRGGGPRRA